MGAYDCDCTENLFSEMRERRERKIQTMTDEERKEYWKNRCICESNDFEQGDTLYYHTSWDGGVEYNYIRNIKYCPVCGKELPNNG